MTDLAFELVPAVYLTGRRMQRLDGSVARVVATTYIGMRKGTVATFEDGTRESVFGSRARVVIESDDARQQRAA